MQYSRFDLFQARLPYPYNSRQPSRNVNLVREDIRNYLSYYNQTIFLHDRYGIVLIWKLIEPQSTYFWNITDIINDHIVSKTNFRFLNIQPNFFLNKKRRIPVLIAF